MKSVSNVSLRSRLFLHLLWWELRRLALPLAAWLMAIIPAAIIIQGADWSWPHYSDLEATAARQYAQSSVETGMALAAILAVYFTGELFIPLRPGAAKARFARPPRRQDALTVAFLIQTVLVIVPFVFYCRGWVMARSWYDDDAQFVREFIPPVPVAAASLALIATLTGDWGIYLLTSALALFALSWNDAAAWPRPLALYPAAVLMTAVSLTAAYLALRYPRRWIILAGWFFCLAVLIRG